MLDRFMNPSLDAIKIIAFEAEPVLDRVHHTYTLVFSVEKNNIRWKVTHQFSRFKILNLLIRKLAPKLIYSKFPKDSATTLLGLRLSKKAVDNRRLMLDIWIREVVANFEIFPEEIVHSLNDFIKAPKKITTVLEKNFPGSGDDQIQSNIPLNLSGKRNSDSYHIFPCIGTDTKNDDNVHPLAVTKRKHKAEIAIRAITRIVSKIIRKISQLTETDWGGTVTICIARTEKLIMINGNHVHSVFFSEIFYDITVYSQILMFATIFNSILGLFPYIWGGLNFSPTAILFFSSFAMYIHLLTVDYARSDEEPVTNISSHMIVQETLRKFLNFPLLEYTDKVHTFPSFQAYGYHNSPSSKSDSSEDSYNSDDIDLLSSEESPVRGHDDHHFILANSPHYKAHGTHSHLQHGTGTTIPHTTHKTPSSPRTQLQNQLSEKTDRPALHESLVPGSTYENVEFNDLCPEARAMYSDRSETHAMKVRGESYCEDNKKVNPGHAMSKLLLLELFEVEAKDGDRHDHVVSRGAAKRRLEALRTLPEKLFFIVVNFQIPGDPPVSIVSYFGLPMDLIERYPGSSTLKFLKMFERFIDIPRTEKERLEAWGVFSAEAEETVTATVVASHSSAGKDVTTTTTATISTSTTTNQKHVSLPLSNTYPTSTTQKRISLPLPTQAVAQVSPLIIAHKEALPPAPLLSPKEIYSPVKKSRLSALLARTSSGLGSRPSSTSASTSRLTGSSPRHKAVVENGSASPTARQMMMKYRTRSSSFNDAAVTAATAAASGNETTTDTPSGSVLTIQLSDSNNSSSAPSGDPSPVHSRKNSSSIRALKSCDNVEYSPEIRRREIDCEGYASNSPPVVESNDEKSVNTKVAAVPSTTTSSGGWKIPTDITWPNAHDKGALPPSDFRNERFKLIPSITLGPWVVKAAVGATPALLGRKVVQRYFRGDDYMEIDIHVGSSVIASQVVGLCRGYAKHIVNDVGIVIQGEHEGELPERILAVGSLSRINVNIRQKLD